MQMVEVDPVFNLNFSIVLMLDNARMKMMSIEPTIENIITLETSFLVTSSYS